MALYVVGDLQGCLEPLKRLLDTVRFDPAADTLWLTGDLINRGPHSLEALRFVKGMGRNALTVLGNHDLHLLAVAYGPHKLKKKDTLDAILEAHDRETLLRWLLHRPLLHFDEPRNLTLVHAGVHPLWTLEQARVYAAELETVLRGDDAFEYFEEMYGDTPGHWADSHGGIDRLRAITNAFTRMRMCDLQGHLDMKYKGAPGGQPAGWFPWFDHPGRRATDTHILFGHWAALGVHEGAGVTALDSGCVWGARLTALRLTDDGQRDLVSVSCSS
ncbi:symmetrical bis(5'-nucleosyl)-tetraphosphatase [Endothiovibrio diazotrophicus]